MAGSLTRRAVLGGGVSLGAAALLSTGQSASAALSAGGRAAGGGPMQPVYGPARVGATFDLLPFQPGITTYPAAVADWNKTTGTATKCWKVYYQESQFPTTLDAKLTTIIENGIQALISFKPSPLIGKPQGQQDKVRLQQAIQMLSSATVGGKKLNAEICLWQEVGPKDMTADQYQDLVAFCEPVIHPQFPLVFDAPGSLGLPEWQAFRPDDSLLDGYALDMYCSDFIRHDQTLDQFMSFAGKKPVGIWEIGNTASAGFAPSEADIKTYLYAIATSLTARLLSGLPVGSVAWYNGPATASQSGVNEIVGTHPYKFAPTDIQYYGELYHAINGKFPSPITA
jgi:hypothetical protein